MLRSATDSNVNKLLIPCEGPTRILRMRLVFSEMHVAGRGLAGGVDGSCSGQGLHMGAGL